MTAIAENNEVFGKLRWHYYRGEKAIEVADFGLNSIYIVVSKKLATDIFSNNHDYDSSHLSRGLRDGWLQLVINPEKFEELLIKTDAIKAIPMKDTIEDGWYRLLIVPQWGKQNFRRHDIPMQMR